MRKNTCNPILACLLYVFCAVHSYAQNGSLSGTVIDESNKETLVGATVMIEGLSGVGASTDIDGQYLINGIPVGTYTVKISSLSYDTKNISSVVIESGKTTTLDVAMEVSDTELGVVVIETDFRTETINSILTIQKNNIAISDGISKDIIQRSPDKNTGEVLKRMSGTTITDGKFVVIRGLSDRYNTAMINGNILPSTEPDRKNFSFDLFPSALLDNLFIYKSAQPDLPGDFAGGIIQMQTRDIPEEDFIAISAGTGYNFQSTFKPYYQYRGGEKDWLGIDDGTRSLPDGLPSTEVYNNTDDDETTETTDADRAEYSKLFGNYWGAIPYESTPLDQSYQLSGGIVKKLNDDKDKFGFIAALTYNNSYSTSYATRQDVDVLQSLKYTYLDTIYKQNILWGTLLNLSYKLGDKHKFSFKNSYSINATDNTTIRGGQNNDFTRYVDYEYYEFISNRLLTNVLSGESLFPNSTIKINWNIGINSLIRDQPDLRTSLYYKGFVPTFEGDTLYQTFVFYNPSPEGSYRFWSYLEENSKLASLDLSYPFIIGETPQAFKTGVQVLNKDRNFSARALGYSVNSSFYSNPEYLTYLTLPRDVIFSDQYLADSIFFLEDATLKSDSYTATQNNFSTYAMLDNKIKDLRIVWGVRAEFFSQTLNSFYNSSSTTPEPISVNSKDLDTIGLPFDLLPSINFIYSLTEKFNIRLSGSKTVTRPELRELAPFGYYDYESSTYVIGNPELLATDIYNGDLRFEYYPGKGQIVSASAFYKYFNNPIELRRYENTTYKQIDPINESEARNYGFEFELRKNFSFLGTNPVFEKLSFNTNLAYINSLVQVTDTAYYGVTERPLQGQSPYVVNAGLTYFNPDNGFSVTTLYNVIGRRITELGNKDYADIYENPRPLLDAQASIPMLKDAALLRITIADILNKDLIFYQDIDESGKYEEDIDNLIAQINTGNKLSLSFTYKF